MIKSGNKIKWDLGWDNILERITADMFSDIEKIKKILYDFKVDFQLMTGSGPTVFGIINNKKKGNYIKRNWPREKDSLFLTTTLNQNY